jgi:predicted kinase
MRSAVGLDEQRGERRLAEAGERAIPAPPDHVQRRELAERLAAAADSAPVRRDLQDRVRSLLPGHPSSGYDENGARRPPAPSLADFERPLPPLTDAAWSDHVNQVTTRLDKARAEGLTTEVLHTVDPDHEVWTLERATLHSQILTELYGQAADVPCNRQAVLAGGLGGAGKSTVLEQRAGIDRSAYLTIDPDQFKDQLARRGLLPDVPGLSPMEASSLAHEESSYLARQLAIRALADGKNIIWDIIMSSSASGASRIAELRAADYKAVDGLFVDIPIDVSVARAERRHRRDHDRFLAGEGHGGRHVPPAITWRQADPVYGSLNRRAFEELKDQCDSWSVYDNSKDGEAPVLVERGGRDRRAVATSNLESRNGQ